MSEIFLSGRLSFMVIVLMERPRYSKIWTGSSTDFSELMTKPSDSSVFFVKATADFAASSELAMIKISSRRSPFFLRYATTTLKSLVNAQGAELNPKVLEVDDWPMPTCLFRDKKNATYKARPDCFDCGTLLEQGNDFLVTEFLLLTRHYGIGRSMRLITSPIKTSIQNLYTLSLGYKGLASVETIHVRITQYGPQKNRKKRV
ncbi:hypothetical protein OUZ56_024664 [Daphnia magna]|uniref:Uncharacterized protein n=1 Tax=Daphnia magna TaxID=35525 RepID=A0ABR0B1F5_9CRUS|nr:hypothetical protein OUZ56_024664 [Daphnia magna]